MTIKAILIAVPLMVVGWFSVLIVVALLSDEAPAYVVVLPKATLLRDLPEESAILSSTKLTITLTSDQTGFARDLYAAGARLVLPAGLPGCLPLPAGASRRQQ